MGCRARRGGCRPRWGRQGVPTAPHDHSHGNESSSHGATRRHAGPDKSHVGPTTRTWARQLARGPDKSDVGPMVCVWAAPPTCMSRGLRAYQGVYVRTQGLTCERAMWLSGRYHPGQAPDNVREQPIPPGTAQNADHFAPNSAFPPFFGEVVCVLGAIPPRTVPALPPSGGGNCIIRAATRRRHADAALRMAQNPHRYQCRARCRGRGPGWGTGGWRKPRNCTHHQVPRRNKSRPTRTTPRRFGTKLSLHARPRRISGIKLSLLTRNGSIWRNLRMRGEFCTVFTTKKPSRENFVPNAGQRWG